MDGADYIQEHSEITQRVVRKLLLRKGKYVQKCGGLFEQLLDQSHKMYQ
jgi:hypothetical protein